MSTHFFSPSAGIVIRWFQIGAGISNPFDTKDFELRLVHPLTQFMRTMSESIKTILIVSNGDSRYNLGEKIDADGETPTTRAVTHQFSEFTKKGIMQTYVETDWGANAGSARALNTGWRRVLETHGITHVISWNPELQLTMDIVSRMFAHLERHNLSFVGAYRQGYWRLWQWRLAQNTACLYPVAYLRTHEGFDVVCDGDEGITIDLPDYGKTLIAGMEDVELAFRAFKQSGVMPRWGMVGRAKPFLWDVDFEPSSERARLLQEKIARQPFVVRHWAKRHFPDTGFNILMDQFFANSHSD